MSFTQLSNVVRPLFRFTTSLVEGSNFYQVAASCLIAPAPSCSNKLFDMLLIQVNRGRRLGLFGLFSNLKSKARSQAIVIHPALALVRRWGTFEQLECSLQIPLIKGNLDQGGKTLGSLQERERFLSLRLPGPKLG